MKQIFHIFSCSHQSLLPILYLRLLHQFFIFLWLQSLQVQLAKHPISFQSSNSSLVKSSLPSPSTTAPNDHISSLKDTSSVSTSVDTTSVPLLPVPFISPLSSPVSSSQSSVVSTSLAPVLLLLLNHLLLLFVLYILYKPEKNLVFLNLGHTYLLLVLLPLSHLLFLKLSLILIGRLLWN